jgi:hypothetical protein
MNTKVNVYKFSVTATETPALEINNPMEFLNSKYQNGYISGLHELQRSGIYKLMGWIYDFKPFLNRYLVKQHGDWTEYYAPNKTKLRATIYGRIQEIHQI